MPARLRALVTETAIIGGDQLAGELAQLEPLAEAMFGGLRRRGWLARKIHRECVDPHTSALLVRGSVTPGELVEVERVVGYVLVGRPASLGDLVRGAGVGVLPSLRGHGFGTALIEAAVERSARAGAAAIEFLAEQDRLAWYARLGFPALRNEWTLEAAATGEHDRFEWTLAPAPVSEGARVWSWIAEAWQRTPASERGWLAQPIANSWLRAWASREGPAVLIHRFELGEPGQTFQRPGLFDALNQVRAALPRGTPVLLYPCPARRSWLRALQDTDWRIAQQSWVVRRAIAGQS